MKPLFFRRHGSWGVCCMLAVLLLAPTARADDGDPAQAFQTLEAALRDEAATHKKTPSSAKDAAEDEEETPFAGRRADMTVNWTAQLRAYMDQGSPEQVERSLSEISAYSKSEAVRTACARLREDFRREHDAKEQAAVKRYHDAATLAENAVKSARVPADLDEALRQLGGLGEPFTDYRASEAVRRESNRVQSLRRYVISWQDYLASRQNGDTQTAMEKLRNISQEGSADVFPRSDILARMEELKTSRQTSIVDRMAAVLGKLKTCDQIPDVVRELRALQTQASNDYSANSAKTNLDATIGELQSYAEVYNTYQAGLPTSVEAMPTRYGTNQEQMPAEVLNVKAQLLRLVCARQLNVEDRLKPSADEPMPAYLDRLMTDARNRGDARMILRVSSIQRQVSSRSGSPYVTAAPPEYTGALQAMIAAQNQEEAGQFVPAVISYETALKTGSDVVPAKVIGARLDAIKAAHPAEYEKGMQISVSATSVTGTGNFQRGRDTLPTGP